MLVYLRRDSETLGAILEEADAYRRSVSEASSFRPSIREGRSLVARLWGLVQATNPERLARVSSGFSDALGLPENVDLSWHESISAVLTRPTTRDVSAGQRLSRNVLVSVANSCQLLTAAAHADDYERYPAALLRSMSMDLRRSLGDASYVLKSL
jgi:hypothetical protein